MVVGILALQGDFSAHQLRLSKLGFDSTEVRTKRDLDKVTAIVIPGGESSVLLKLLEADLETAIVAGIRSGMPTLVTCAGLILLANEVTNPEQRSLGLLDISLKRNGYGRQLDSFINENLSFTDAGKSLIQEKLKREPSSFEGVFIRAPKIERLGSAVTSLVEINGSPILVRQGNILGAAFHPELSPTTDILYSLLFSLKGNSC